MFMNKCLVIFWLKACLLLQDKDSDVFQSSAMVLHMDDSSNMANVALIRCAPLCFVPFWNTSICDLSIRRRVRASKTKAATTSFSSTMFITSHPSEPLALLSPRPHSSSLLQRSAHNLKLSFRLSLLSLNNGDRRGRSS